MEQINLKLKRTKIHLELDDKVYVLTKPNFGEYKEFNSKRKAISENDSEGMAELTVSFLEGCGLPKEVCYSLEVSMIKDIIELLAESKKN